MKTEDLERLKALMLEEAPAIMALHDPEHRILWANKAYREATGRSLEELEGQECFHGWGLGTLCPGCPVTCSLETGEPAEAELSPESQPHWPETQGTWLARAVPLKDGQQRVVAVLETAFDVTARKLLELEQLRESEARFSKIFRKSPSFMLLTELEDGRVIEVNEAYCRLTGYSREELVGRVPVDLGILSAEDRREGLRLIREQGGFQNREERRWAKDGHVKHVLLSAEAMELEGRVCILTMGVDISMRKAMERSLEQAKEEADEASRAKSEFLANMSHELRTPLNAVKGMVELARRQSAQARVKEYLELAKQSTDHLTCLINDVLDLSRIETGRIQLHQRPFSLRDSLEGALHPLQAEAAGKGLEFRVEVDGRVPDRLSGDASRLRQIFENVVGNAVKFTHQGGVSVRLQPARGWETQPGRFRLEASVADTGIGIPEDKQQAILTNFGPVNPAVSEQYGGSGLGLAICRHFLEMMDGELRLESREGRGSTFTFSALLGLPPAEEAKASEAASRGAERRPLTILVAEDSRMNQIFTQELLQDRGHTVILAENGLEALRILSRQQVDLVLMDIRMPDLDGQEALRRIRSDPPDGADPQVPVIALTAYALEEDRHRLLEQGFDGYLAKPIDIEAFERLMAGVEASKPPRDPV